MERASARHVVSLHEAELPDLTAFARNARADLVAAADGDSYDVARAIAATAPLAELAHSR